MPPLNQVISRVGSIFGFPTSDATRVTQAGIAQQAQYLIPVRQQMAILRAYYQNNGLYALLNRELVQANAAIPGMMPLRNPTFRIVEFYSSHLWPGSLDEALQIETENANLADAITRVWQWSNFQSTKQVLARDLALYGEMYIKVASDIPGKVYFQRLDPGDVTDIELDVRGYPTYLRLDIPTKNPDPAQGGILMHTEVWDKARDSMKIWLTPTATNAMPDLSAAPAVDMSMMGELGIDFIPVAHAKFRDVGDDRGQSAIMPIIDKIDEANRQATRLAQIMFRYNRALWVATAGGLDKDGRQIPAIDVGIPEPVSVGDDTVMSLPGASDIKPLVPSVNFDAYREMLLDTMAELEQDAPEMGYSKLFQKISNDVSGVAIRMMLAPAVARVEEARGNGWMAIIRADQMAITLAQIMGLPDFQVGTFETGDLEHQFTETDVLPLSRREEAEADLAVATAVSAKITAGWSERQALMDAGLSEADVEIMQQERSTADVLPTEGQ